MLKKPWRSRILCSNMAGKTEEFLKAFPYQVAGHVNEGSYSRLKYARLGKSAIKITTTATSYFTWRDLSLFSRLYICYQTALDLSVGDITVCTGMQLNLKELRYMM